MTLMAKSFINVCCLCRVFKDPNEREDFWGSQCNRQSVRSTVESGFPLSMLIRLISFLLMFPTVSCSALSESNAAWKTKINFCGCRSPGSVDRPMNIPVHTQKAIAAL